MPKTDKLAAFYLFPLFSQLVEVLLGVKRLCSDLHVQPHAGGIKRYAGEKE